MQLVDRFPLVTLQGKNPKIQFREPKAHLEHVVEALSDRGILRDESTVLGLSYIDADLLDMLPKCSAHGYEVLHDLDPLGWSANMGLESIQSALCSDETIKTVLELKGKVDFLSARFILEHAESARRFLSSLCRLVKPGGHILIEVPDASKIIQYQNHALLWEDHFTYFVKDSLLKLVKICGLECAELAVYPYPYEDVLSLLLRVPSRNMVWAYSAPFIERSSTLTLDAFKESFADRGFAIRKKVDALLRLNESVAIFGAGHHASKFVNFYGLGGKLVFVVDDNPQKTGLYMPGTDLQVWPSEELLTSDVSICISTLSPEGEEKVRSLLPKYFEAGRIFYPAFSVGVP